MKGRMGGIYKFVNIENFFLLYLMKMVNCKLKFHDLITFE
jgi:hypothetical protein